MKNIRAVLAVGMVALACVAAPSRATTDSVRVFSNDSARAFSKYFHASADTGAPYPDEFYSRHWATWLQYHRAVEARPELRRRFLSVSLPLDSPGGRLRTQSLLHSIPQAQVRAHPTHVFVLDIGIRSQDAVRFLRRDWPRVAAKDIYDSTPKSFRFGFSSERLVKSQPLFYRPRTAKNVNSYRRLCYGMYASREDAQRDLAQWLKYLRLRIVIMRLPLTPGLAGAFIYEPVAGRQP